YFDVFVEYAKASPDDMLIRIAVHNRGADEALLHVLPTLWFRNLWSGRPNVQKPMLTGDGSAICAHHAQLGGWQLDCEGEPRLLFTENETNNRRLFGSESSSPFVKDGINDFLVHNRPDAVNPARIGTKAAAYYPLEILPGGAVTVRLRLHPS